MDTKTLEPILAEHPFFKDLKPEYLSILVGCASNVRFEANEMIFQHGGPANKFYIIRHGEVAIEVHDPRRRTIRIQTLRDGDVFGWSWMFAGRSSHFDARALILTRAIAMDGDCLRGKFNNDHSLGYEMMLRFTPVIIRRLEAASMQLLDIYK